MIATNDSPTLRRVFVLGCPSAVGGASTELWHTIRLWRSFGLNVTVVPTWHALPQWRERLAALDVEVHQVQGVDDLQQVPGLPGATVVSFCNGQFLKAAAKLREMGCPLVWVNCMTWLFGAEVVFCRRHGPMDGYVFQSDFQRQTLLPQLTPYGLRPEQCHLIRGAFCTDEFPLATRPHGDGQPFVFGRIARADADKWSSNLWPIYSAVRHARKQARVMAWSDRLTEKCGLPPRWVDILPQAAETAQEFMSTLHCLFPINGDAQENWPRAGLEAMAAGVPIVAQRQWGWCEMIEHGVTGFLGANDSELADYVTMLANDEDLRLRIASAARGRLTSELANRQTIWQGWRALFASLESEAPNGNGSHTRDASRHALSNRVEGV